MSLEARLKRIEDKEEKLHPQRQYRFIRLAASDEEEVSIRREVADAGYDPDTDLFLINLVDLEPLEPSDNV